MPIAAAAGGAKRAADEAPAAAPSPGKKQRTEGEGTEVADRAKQVFTRK